MPYRRFRRRHSRPRRTYFFRLFLAFAFLVVMVFAVKRTHQHFFQTKARHQISQPSFQDLSSFSDKQQRQLTRWLKLQVSSGAFPSLSVSVSRSHGVVYASTLGQPGSDLGIIDPVRSTYPLGPVSKPLSVAALLTFVEAGQIDLDAPISTYLADYRISASITDENAITPRLLASHLAGVPRNGLPARPPFNGGGKRFYEQLPRLQLRHPPGASRSYSNLAYGLLEMSMMNVAKQPFSEIIKARIFEPLGMSHAFSIHNGTPDQLDSLAKGYHCDHRCSSVDTMDWTQFNVAANGFAASAHDLSLFLSSMLQEESSPVLNPTSLQLTRRPQALNSGDNQGRFTRNTIMWRKKEVPGVGWAFRSVGGLHGASATMYLLPEHDIAVAVLSNRNLTTNGVGDVSEIAEIILQKAVKSNPESGTANAER